MHQEFNLRDNRKERIDANQEERKLRKRNREQNVVYAKSSRLTQTEQGSFTQKVLFAFACFSNVLQPVANMGAAKYPKKNDNQKSKDLAVMSHWQVSPRNAAVSSVTQTIKNISSTAQGGGGSFKKE